MLGPRVWEGRVRLGRDESCQRGDAADARVKRRGEGDEEHHPDAVRDAFSLQAGLVAEVVGDDVRRRGPRDRRRWHEERGHGKRDGGQDSRHRKPSYERAHGGSVHALP